MQKPNEKYNGWTNYATWRVHLEMFDGMDSEILQGMSRYDAGEFLKTHAEDTIEYSSQEGVARDWAMAFINEVNWYEIADHLMPEDDAEEGE